MTTATTNSAAAKPTPAVIILGRDGAGKVHASWFGEQDKTAAQQAADNMGMIALPVAGDELRSAASRLPEGRLFGSGRAFVPFVKATTFDALAAHVPDADRKLLAAPRPVEKRATDPGKGIGGTIERPKPTLPQDWSKIVIGSLVLCSDDPDQGWFLAVVVKVADDGLLTLRWRDWVDLPPFTRKREQIALLNPAFSV